MLGGTGSFGAEAVRLLARGGVASVAASRRTGVNVEDRAVLRSFLRPRDVVLDAAGPFQRRSTALLDVALEVRADVVDLSDSAAYARALGARRGAIEASGVAVLTGCSAVSAVVATLVRASGIDTPVRIDAWLAPASRETARVGTAQALVSSLRAGAALTCEFAPIRGIPVESGLEVQLPAIWPSVQEAAFWVDPHVPGLRPILALAARSGLARAAALALTPVVVPLARAIGTRAGIFAVRAEGPAAIARWTLTAPHGSQRIAVAPAVLAVRDLAIGAFAPTGLVPADRQVTPDALFAILADLGIAVARADGPQPSL